MKKAIKTIKLLLVLMGSVCHGFAFTEPPKSLQQRNNNRNFPSPTQLSSSSENSDSTAKPILIVGATGSTGRKLVQQLVAKNQPVRALVRNPDKAKEIFEDIITVKEDSSSSSSCPLLEIIVADLSQLNNQSIIDKIENAVNGCSTIISAASSVRFSKFLDFLPHRLFRFDVSTWADTTHPYYTNYQAQCLLVDLAKKYSVQRFIRITGLSTGSSAFSFVSLVFSVVLSMRSRYNFAFEQYLRKSCLPYLILRPGGLADDDRDSSITHIQVGATGSLPPPARVSRSDVAALAVAACNSTLFPPNKSHTLAVQACGEMNPKPQGKKEDGFATVQECLQSVVSVPTYIEPLDTKPYGIAVGIFVYSLLAISITVVSKLVSKILRLG